MKSAKKYLFLSYLFVGYLYGYHEYDFLHSIMWQQSLSPRQEQWLEKIFRRINLQIVVQPEVALDNFMRPVAVNDFHRNTDDADNVENDN